MKNCLNSVDCKTTNLTESEIYN